VDDILNWLWQGTAVAAAAFVACRLLDRAPAHARYVVCAAALAAVMALPLVGLLAAPTVTIGPSYDAVPAEPALPIPEAWWTSAAVVVFLWLIWIGIGVLRVSLAFVALRRTQRSLRPFPRDIESGLRVWTAVRSGGRQTRLTVSPRVRSAAVVGCCSPVVAVAPSLLDRLPAEDLDRIVIHEWAHVQRRDDIANALQTLMRIVAGWHPAVWWLDRQLSLEREIACDEMAVALTGNPKTYASSLTAVATLAPRPAAGVATLGVLSPPALSRRIVRILATRPAASPGRSRCAAGAAILGVAACAVAVGTLQPITIAAAVPAIAGVGDIALRLEAIAPAAFPAAASGPSASQRREGGGRTPANAERAPEPEPPTVARKPAAAATETDSREAPVVESFARPDALPLLTTPTAARLLDLTLPAVQPGSGGTPHEGPAADRAQTPWSAAADAGVAVGRGSQKAGVATASFVSRLGRKIAGSF
jgi:beta-lactamase regulating signal transducer with metallopeptidase domain